MTARELFREAGVSAKLYRDFLEPILLVTLFAPGERLSGQRFINVEQNTVSSLNPRQIRCSKFFLHFLEDSCMIFI